MDTCETCGENLILVEYSLIDPCHYDGVSELWCQKCDVRKGRWSGKKLEKEEHEPPYGGEHRKNCPNA